MKRIVLFLLVFSVINLNAFAATRIQQNNETFFNTDSATLQFNKFNEKLSVPEVSLNNLTRYVQELEDLQSQAEYCVTKSEIKLKKLNELLKSSQLEKSILIQQTEYKYLKKKKLFYAKHLSECRFYVYRSKEALVGYNNTIQELSAHKVLMRSTPIWQINDKGVSTALKKINLQNLYQSVGIGEISLMQTLFGLVLIGFALAIAIYLQALIRHSIGKNPPVSPAIRASITVLALFLVPFTFLGMTSALLSVNFSKLPEKPLLETISQSAFLFVLLFALSKTLFFPPYGEKSPLRLSASLGKLFHQRVTVILAWVFLGILSPVNFDNQSLSLPLIELARTLYLTVFIGILAWATQVIYIIPAMKKLGETVLTSIKITISFLLVASVSMEWFGFHQLTIFINTALLLSLGLSLSAVGVWRLINDLYEWLDNNKYQSARALRNLLGVKSHRRLKEIWLIKAVGHIVVIFLFLLLFMQIWGVSPNIIDSVMDGMTSGFIFSEIKVIPMNIVAAVLSFSLILLGGRLVGTLAANKERFEGEKDAQVAVASIMLYVAFTIASLLALLIIGVNFTGLVVIAGALSVGVGLGLQNIVNNFVSGLILLIEKPIKPGDRVIVGSTEGFVKKIRLRSTQITTLAKEDVIVPNADLIANQVTNYMFRDRQWRVVCQVGVAYGSDINLVRDSLLEVASKHSEVVQDTPNQPAVIFKSFGDSSLIFELWCIIKDVNKKFLVVSELNFAIDDAFKAHKITIAFPQRDLHIKNHSPVEPI